MLEHSLPTASKPEGKKITEDTADKEVKEEKKKKKGSHKKKRQKEEMDDTAGNTTVLPVVTTTTTSDPFSSSLLDAWLDSPSGDSLVSTPSMYVY